MSESSLELDKEVAEIIGHKVCDRAKAVELSNRMTGGQPWDSWYANVFYLEDSLTQFGMDILPRYSVDLNAAFEAAEKFGLFKERGLDLGFWGDGRWGVWNLEDREYGESYRTVPFGFGDTPALAICDAIVNLAKERQ